jgi:hypothetical protein
MTVFRDHCLSLLHGTRIAVTTNVQQIVEEDYVECIRIQNTKDALLLVTSGV